VLNEHGRERRIITSFRTWRWIYHDR